MLEVGADSVEGSAVAGRNASWADYAEDAAHVYSVPPGMWISVGDVSGNSGSTQLPGQSGRPSEGHKL